MALMRIGILDKPAQAPSSIYSSKGQSVGGFALKVRSVKFPFGAALRKDAKAGP